MAAQPTVMKSIKISPELLEEIEATPGYETFAEFARDALNAYLKTLAAQGTSKPSDKSGNRRVLNMDDDVPLPRETPKANKRGK